MVRAPCPEGLRAALDAALALTDCARQEMGRRAVRVCSAQFNSDKAAGDLIAAIPLAAWPRTYAEFCGSLKD